MFKIRLDIFRYFIPKNVNYSTYSNINLHKVHTFINIPFLHIKILENFVGDLHINS
jgi:hypothetical protein